MTTNPEPRPPRVKPSDVIDAHVANMSVADWKAQNAILDEALMQQWKNAKVDQEAKGVTFDLSFEDFLLAVSDGRRRTMLKKIAEGNFKGFMKSNSGYCISWKDKAAYKTRNMNKDTVAYIRRGASRELLWIKKDDKHEPQAIEKIVIARTGTTWDEKTKNKISETKTGVPQTDEHVAKRAAALTGKTNSDATKAKKSAGATKRWENYRANKEKNNGNS